MMATIRRYLISGLLFWVPVWITLLVLRFLVNLMDDIFKLLPYTYQPDNLLGFHLPGLGIIFVLIILFFTGMIVANFLGKRLIEGPRHVFSWFLLTRIGKEEKLKFLVMLMCQGKGRCEGRAFFLKPRKGVAGLPGYLGS